MTPLATSVCPFNPPCVRSKRPRVYRHHAHMCFNMFARCRHTRRRFECTHGDVLHGHTLFSACHTTHRTAHTHHNTRHNTNNTTHHNNNHNNTRRQRQRETADREREDKMKDVRQEKTRRKTRDKTREEERRSREEKRKSREEKRRSRDQEKIKLKEKRDTMCCVCLCGFAFSCFFFNKITRHANNYELTKLPIANHENGFFPAIFWSALKMTNCKFNDLKIILVNILPQGNLNEISVMEGKKASRPLRGSA